MACRGGSWKRDQIKSKINLFQLKNSERITENHAIIQNFPTRLYRTFNVDVVEAEEDIFSRKRLSKSKDNEDLTLDAAT